ncbi:MAG: ABC transporter ATP-binding protein [Betaproteobacteria bacterium]|nr:ABC transporter ATP-binding protein [Betaproteobacteria bacterium]
MTAAIELIDVHKSFGHHQVLDGFSLRIDQGQTWGLLGPNGCGKSTVLNMLCHLISCDKGQVNLLGMPVHRLGLDVRAQIGFCPQRSALYPDLLPAENLLFFARLFGLTEKQSHQRVTELMHDFSLVDFSSTPVKHLSGGWQQRLHLAVALINRPTLLLLDEPTSAVDTEARLAIWNLIEKLRDEGTTILMTSHHLAEAERLCHQVALMRNGKLVAQGSVADLLARAPGQAVAKVQTEDVSTLTQCATMLGWPIRHHGGATKLFVPSHLNLREILDALDGVKITSISLHPVTLDDAYLELVNGEYVP